MVKWRELFAKLVLSQELKQKPRTTIHTAEFTHPPTGWQVSDLTETTIRSNEGELWQPPAPARRDRRRPPSDHW
jgi:hypothetical protein